MRSKETEFAKGFGFRRVKDALAVGDTETLSTLIRSRFNERFVAPIDSMRIKHGFTMMANACLLIESLQSFIEGRRDNRKKSRDVFVRFLSERPKMFGKLANKKTAGLFYDNIRCGILHQAE